MSLCMYLSIDIRGSCSQPGLCDRPYKFETGHEVLESSCGMFSSLKSSDLGIYLVGKKSNNDSAARVTANQRIRSSIPHLEPYTYLTRCFDIIAFEHPRSARVTSTSGTPQDFLRMSSKVCLALSASSSFNSWQART